MKVVHRRIVTKNRRFHRAATEKRILRLLDHPFLRRHGVQARRGPPLTPPPHAQTPLQFPLPSPRPSIAAAMKSNRVALLLLRRSLLLTLRRTATARAQFVLSLPYPCAIAFKLLPLF